MYAFIIVVLAIVSMMTTSSSWSDRWTVLAFTPAMSSCCLGGRMRLDHRCTSWKNRRRRRIIPNATVENEHDIIGSENDQPSLAVVYDDVERYRNRSILLERTIQQKIQEHRLTERKLVVLQDTVQKLVRKHEKEISAAVEQEKQMAQKKIQEFRDAANILQQAAWNKTKEEWERKFEESKSAQIRTLKALQIQWEEKEAQMIKKKNQLWNEYQILKDKYEQEQERWEQDARKKLQLQAQLAREQNSIEDEKAKILELEQMLNNAKTKTKSVKAEAQKEIGKLQEALEKSHQKVDTLKNKWETLAESKRRLQRELETTQAKLNNMETILANPPKTNETDVMEQTNNKAEIEKQLHIQHEEAILVAQAAVAAAERREAKLAKERTALLNDLQIQQKEKEALMDQITNLKKQLQERETSINQMEVGFNSKGNEVMNPLIPEDSRIDTHQQQGHGSRSEFLRSKIKTFVSVLRPGSMGCFMQRHVRNLQTLRPFVQRWIDRIPFRIVRKKNENVHTDEEC